MMKKRLTAAIAALCLILTLLPLNVWAAEGDTSTGDTPSIATVRITGRCWVNTSSWSFFSSMKPSISGMTTSSKIRE